MKLSLSVLSRKRSECVEFEGPLTAPPLAGTERGYRKEHFECSANKKSWRTVMSHDNVTSRYHAQTRCHATSWWHVTTVTLMKLYTSWRHYGPRVMTSRRASYNGVEFTWTRRSRHRRGLRATDAEALRNGPMNATHFISIAVPFEFAWCVQAWMDTFALRIPTGESLTTMSGIVGLCLAFWNLLLLHFAGAKIIFRNKTRLIVVQFCSVMLPA